LDKQLAGKDFIVGEISIADFATFPWIRTHSWSGVSIEGLDNIKVGGLGGSFWQRWLGVMHGREGVQRGLKVPHVVKLNEETTKGTLGSLVNLTEFIQSARGLIQQPSKL
jgi:GSH-dependent disulfide-bond oxidoreductase